MCLKDYDRIIFVTPFFGDTGSEVALFNLIIQLKGFEIIVISRSKGELASRLPERIKFYDYRSFYGLDRKISFLRRVKRFFFRPENHMDHFLDTIAGKESTLFYVNTILMPDVVRYLKKKKVNFVLHWHELQHMFVHLKKQDLMNMLFLPDLIFTSSATVKNLLGTMGRSSNLEISYPAINVEKIRSGGNSEQLKTLLRIDPDAFVIAMSGTLDRNKNPEMFLEIGRQLQEDGIKIHLIWVGVHEETAYNYFLSKRAVELNLENNCSWISKTIGQEYLDYLDLADCFVLTSMQESFSMVVVEALALGKPVFSFRSGGPAEIIDNALIGALVDNYSSVEMAARIRQFLKGEICFNPELARARAMDFSADMVFNRWFARLLDVRQDNKMPIQS